jgi:hypothetical protein
MRKAIVLWLMLLPMWSWAQSAAPARPSGPSRSLDDARIREAMIADSIAQYRGNCPCPYSTMRNGRNCGTRSAYSKPGGAAPLCYPGDISDAMVQAYRKR